MLRAFAACALLGTAVAGNAAAASPLTPVPVSGATVGEKNPLTPAQQDLAYKKYQLALKEIAQPGYLSSYSSTAALCPFSVTPNALGARGGVVGMPASFCAGQYGYVLTRAVEQETPYWCGVAVVQVISDYAWGYLGDTHKYSQTYISNTWTHTGPSGTSTTAMVRGLNGAVGEKLPKGFVYSGVYHDGKLTGPRSAVEWHGLLRTDLSAVYQMPMAVSVSPMDPTLEFGLKTWRDANAPKQNAGHWIDIFGWEGMWDYSIGPTVSYDDSGILGSGGVKGVDPAINVYIMIKTYNPNHGTSGVVW